jgi:NADH-quinone oxidoreductase subunit J
MMITLVGALKGADQLAANKIDANIGLTKRLGMVLFNDFLVPFELSSVLFLAAMVGAVMLAKKNIH